MTQATPAVAAAVTKTPRQVVVICGESVRYDMLNGNRNTGLQTPNLDASPRRAPALSAPAIASRCVRRRGRHFGPGCIRIRTACGATACRSAMRHIIGQRLHDRGIHCAFMGKWHLTGTDYFDTGRAPAGSDPDYWYDMRDYLNELTPEDRLRSRDMATGNDPSWTADKCCVHRVANRAVDFPAKHGYEDFLLVVAPDEPHGPSLCPVGYRQQYKDFLFPRSLNVDDDLKNKPVEQRVWAGERLEIVQQPRHQAGARGRGGRSTR